jgi:hypothetical protein
MEKNTGYKNSHDTVPLTTEVLTNVYIEIHTEDKTGVKLSLITEIDAVIYIEGNMESNTENMSQSTQGFRTENYLQN